MIVVSTRCDDPDAPSGPPRPERRSTVVTPAGPWQLAYGGDIARPGDTIKVPKTTAQAWRDLGLATTA